MRLFFILPVLFLLLRSSSAAQLPAVTKTAQAEKHQQLSAGFSFPTGSFAATHYPGITLSYNRNYGTERTASGARKRKSRWFSAAALSHFTGRKEAAGNGRFRYYGYSLLGLQGGIDWYPLKKTTLSFGTGPALGYYNNTLRFSLTGTVQGHYPLGKKTNITPGISFIKESGSDALWVTSVQLGFIF